MATARIYRPARNAMQSGNPAKMKWVVEFAPCEAKTLDPLMGWVGSGDTQAQVKLRFDSEAEAKAYAERQGLDFQVIATKEAKLITRSYAAKFAFDRVR
ncbi:ETC complex I subunit [Magnetovibrio sp. PR-2]|uniref:ETC complex I subunit n=1 Tax=Magnetovibrio sp. PR-2 TaxID=3120356 RepID=UPI002FCE5199